MADDVVVAFKGLSVCLRCRRYLPTGAARLVYRGTVTADGQFFREPNPELMCPEPCEPSQLEEVKRMASAGAPLI